MEAAFAQLQKEGKADVDSLIKWMKDSKVIGESKDQEDKARGYFSTVPDNKNVTLDQFKEIVGKIAADYKTSVADLSKKLGDAVPALQSMVQGAASTLTAKVINKTKEQEEKVRAFFNDVADKKNVPLEKFKEVISKVAEEFKTSLEGVTKMLEDQGPKFIQSLAGGATSTLTGFMRDLVGKKKTKIIVTPEQEAKVRGHFNACKGDPKNVSLKDFKEVLGIVAGDMKTNVVRVSEMLKKHAPQVLDPKAAVAGAAGFAAGYFGGNQSAGAAANTSSAPVKQSDHDSESNAGDPDNPDPYDDHHDGSEDEDHHSNSPAPSEHDSELGDPDNPDPYKRHHSKSD